MKPSAWQIIVIVVVIVVFVGWKRLPDMARSVGRSMRIFKSEVEQLSNSDDERDDDLRSERRSAASSGEAGATEITEARPVRKHDPEQDADRL